MEIMHESFPPILTFKLASEKSVSPYTSFGLEENDWELFFQISKAKRKKMHFNEGKIQQKGFKLELVYCGYATCPQTVCTSGGVGKEIDLVKF